MYGGKRVLLGFLLLVGYVPLVWTTDYSSLNASTFQLKVNDRLVSSPNRYFELGIFNYTSASPDSSYFLCIRYAPPIDDQAVTWMANRDIPLSKIAVLQFENGNLKLTDTNNHGQDIWYSAGTHNNSAVVSAELLDTGKLVLKNNNGMEVWNSFDHSPPTDTLLPGQHMRLSERHSLNSWQRSGNPAIAIDTYLFGWDASRVLTLSWTCPTCHLDWKGGPYIPAPDVYAAHTIQKVEDVYFHENLGHLYIRIRSDPPTAILSGGPDRVNDTTLKRITMSPDGGLRILQYAIDQPLPLNQTLKSNQTWKAVANWVVSDRPDSRSQCTTFGTCEQFSVCSSDFDSLNPVVCQCPGWDNNTTKGWFKPIDGTNLAKGCSPQTGPSTCTTENGKNTNTTNPGMLELPGVDMPWAGDYGILQDLPNNSSDKCRLACVADCYCAGAVYSEAEHTCRSKTGNLYNLGYPTEALHGTDRISFLRNETVPNDYEKPLAAKDYEKPLAAKDYEKPLAAKDYEKPLAAKDYEKRLAAKDYKLVKFLVLSVGIPGVLLIAVLIFCLWRSENQGIFFWRNFARFQLPLTDFSHYTWLPPNIHQQTEATEGLHCSSTVRKKKPH